MVCTGYFLLCALMNPYLSRVLEIFDGVAISTAGQIFLPVGKRLSTKPWELHHEGTASAFPLRIEGFQHRQQGSPGGHFLDLSQKPVATCHPFLVGIFQIGKTVLHAFHPSNIRCLNSRRTHTHLSEMGRIFQRVPGFGICLVVFITFLFGGCGGGGSGSSLLSGSIGFLDSVTWSGKQFVAVGKGGVVVTSPDGITWTGHASPINVLTGTTLNAVAWLGNQYVAVGSNGGGPICLPNQACPAFVVANYAVILTSPDGLSWTNRFPSALSTVGGTTLNDAMWSGTQYVAVGSSGVGSICPPNQVCPAFVGANYAIILTSSDGIAWTPQTSGTINSLNGVTWSGTQFVTVGANGTILTSPDGKAWTPKTSGTINTLNGAIWSGAQFVAVGANGTILTSPNGIAWTPQTSGTINILNGAIWSGAQFVAVGANGTILTSPNGIAWTLQTSP